jgi:hypothetical protein
MRALPDFAAMITSRLASLSLVALVLSLVGCKPEDEELDYGFVKLEFRRGEGAANPFPGTATIEATMEYGDCYRDFYANNSNLRQDGVDGELVFGTKDQGGEGWVDRLCEIELTGQLDCTVESIEQRLDPPATPHLTVVYNVSGDVDLKNVAFGPLPDREHADCMNGTLPEVRVGLSGVNGYNSDDAEIWHTQSTNPNEALVDQGKAITVYAESQE